MSLNIGFTLASTEELQIIADAVREQVNQVHSLNNKTFIAVHGLKIDIGAGIIYKIKMQISETEFYDIRVTKVEHFYGDSILVGSIFTDHTIDSEFTNLSNVN